MICISPVKFSQTKNTTGNSSKIYFNPNKKQSTDTVNFQRKITTAIKPSNKIKQFLIQNFFDGSFIQKIDNENLLKQEFKNKKLAKTTFLNNQGKPLMQIEIQAGNNYKKTVFREDGKSVKLTAQYSDGNLVEEMGYDKFDKKYIKKFKNEELYEQVLFKKSLGEEYPHLVLNYQNDKLIEAKELRSDGTTACHRKYDATGKLTDDISYAPDGKTPIQEND